MRIEVQSKHRNRARRPLVPVTEYGFAALPVGTNRILRRCGGPVAPQVTPNRQTGTALAKQHVIAQTTWI